MFVWSRKGAGEMGRLEMPVGTLCRGQDSESPGRGGSLKRRLGIFSSEVGRREENG